MPAADVTVITTDDHANAVARASAAEWPDSIRSALTAP
jgi:hypothetical protein